MICKIIVNSKGSYISSEIVLYSFIGVMTDNFCRPRLQVKEEKVVMVINDKNGYHCLMATPFSEPINYPKKHSNVLFEGPIDKTYIDIFEKWVSEEPIAHFESNILATIEELTKIRL